MSFGVRCQLPLALSGDLSGSKVLGLGEGTRGGGETCASSWAGYPSLCLSGGNHGYRRVFVLFVIGVTVSAGLLGGRRTGVQGDRRPLGVRACCLGWDCLGRLSVCCILLFRSRVVIMEWIFRSSFRLCLDVCKLRRCRIRILP